MAGPIVTGNYIGQGTIGSSHTIQGAFPLGYQVHNPYLFVIGTAATQGVDYVATDEKAFIAATTTAFTLTGGRGGIIKIREGSYGFTAGATVYQNITWEGSGEGTVLYPITSFNMLVNSGTISNLMLSTCKNFQGWLTLVRSSSTMKDVTFATGSYKAIAGAASPEVWTGMVRAEGNIDGQGFTRNVLMDRITIRNNAYVNGTDTVSTFVSSASHVVWRNIRYFQNTSDAITPRIFDAWNSDITMDGGEIDLGPASGSGGMSVGQNILFQNTRLASQIFISSPSYVIRNITFRFATTPGTPNGIIDNFNSASFTDNLQIIGNTFIHIGAAGSVVSGEVIGYSDASSGGANGMVISGNTCIGVTPCINLGGTVLGAFLHGNRAISGALLTDSGTGTRNRDNVGPGGANVPADN